MIEKRGGDAERGLVEINLDADDEENADIANDGDGHDDLRAEAELHAQ